MYSGTPERTKFEVASLSAESGRYFGVQSRASAGCRSVKFLAGLSAAVYVCRSVWRMADVSHLECRW
jgi:hypothetical protein